MDTRKYLNLMSNLITMTETKMVRKEGSLTETLHLGGDPKQPTHDELSRTGLGKLALAMQPAFDTDAGGHSERGHEGELTHNGTHNEDDEKFSGKPVVRESDQKKIKLTKVNEADLDENFKSTHAAIRALGMHVKRTGEYGHDVDTGKSQPEMRVAFGPGEEHEDSAYYTHSHSDAVATAKQMAAQKRK